MSDPPSDAADQLSDMVGAPPDITGRHFYRSGGVREMYDHIRVLVVGIAGAVGRMNSRAGSVPEPDDHVPDCAG